MAQAGVGLDMFEVARMERMLMRRPRLAEVAFSERERDFCKRSGQPARSFAECAAAHGAVKKALALGNESACAPHDICVVRARGERTRVELEGSAKAAAQRQGVREIALSLSCTDGVAVANAVALTDAVRPPRAQTPSPQEELRASFKQARSVLDELEHQGEAKKV